MKKEFDKKSFQKAQKKLLLACFSIGIIGIASIICAFAVGNGIKFPSRAEQEEEEYQKFLYHRTYRSRKVHTGRQDPGNDGYGQ